MSVRCGFHGKDVVRHETPVEVRVCSKLHYEAKAELDAWEENERWVMEGERAAELAHERHLENRGADEAYAEERWEAERGVVPFDVAMRAAEEAAAREAAAAPVETPAPSNRDRYAAWRRIPVASRNRAYFALRGTDGVVKFYRVERPATGTYAGRTYVKVMASDVAHKLPFGEAGRVLDEIARDPKTASDLYSSETGDCSKCGTTLTDQESLARLMGPDCFKKYGGAG